MNYLVILSGGVGARMMSERPKQYIEINKKPIIQYTIECFDFTLFKKIIIVVADNWKDYVRNIINNNFDKQLFDYAVAGDSRQESILNGMNAIKDYSSEDVVVIHDAARACLKPNLVKKMIETTKSFDGVMPVIPVKDTIYLSKGGEQIDGLLNRDELFAGQAPEAFNLKRYLEINRGLSKEELASVRGSSEIAYKNGFSIGLIAGDEDNFKITTPNDLERFKLIVGGIC